jgi:hypothetical protein
MYPSLLFFCVYVVVVLQCVVVVHPSHFSLSLSLFFFCSCVFRLLLVVTRTPGPSAKWM